MMSIGRRRFPYQGLASISVERGLHTYFDLFDLLLAEPQCTSPALIVEYKFVVFVHGKRYWPVLENGRVA